MLFSTPIITLAATYPLWPKLDELIGGLKARGFCFARIPEGKAWKH